MSTTTVAPTLNRKRGSLLRNTLLANAIFSTLCAIDFLIFAQPISTFLGWSNGWVLPLIGIGLLGFALYVVSVARAPQIDTSAVKSIIVADITWVILSILVIATPIVPLTLGGKWGVAIVADIVAGFALLQFLGLRRIRNPS